jgi:hypothetical protein
MEKFPVGFGVKSFANTKYVFQRPNGFTWNACLLMGNMHIFNLIECLLPYGRNEFPKPGVLVARIFNKMVRFLQRHDDYVKSWNDKGAVGMVNEMRRESGFMHLLHATTAQALAMELVDPEAVKPVHKYPNPHSEGGHPLIIEKEHRLPPLPVPEKPKSTKRRGWDHDALTAPVCKGPRRCGVSPLSLMQEDPEEEQEKIPQPALKKKKL